MIATLRVLRPRPVRILLAALLTLSFLFESVGLVQAGTVGTISGHVTAATTNQPLANVRVVAASPSGRQSATTDARGFYTLVGLNPDTYTVSFQIQGYQPESFPGVTVVADQNVLQDAALVKSLRTIAQVHARSAGGAFQPNQTTDTYAVTAAQVTNIQGTALNDNADQLLKSLPGASSSTNREGAVIVRGGRANAIGYSFGGMSLVNSYNNQIGVLQQGNIPNAYAGMVDKGNILPTIGIQQLTLTPGVADASFSSTGTGNFNVIPKQGTYPGFSDLMAGIGGGHYQHALAADYGIASPNGRWNEYVAFQGSNFYPNYGDGLSCAAAHSCNMQSNQVDRTFMNNLSYHWGKDNKYGLNFLYLNQFSLGDYDYGITTQGMCFRTCTQAYSGNFSACIDANGNYIPPPPSGTPAQPCIDPNHTLLVGSEFGSGRAFTVAEMWHIMGFETSQQNSYTETLAQAGLPYWATGQYRYGTKLEFTDRINPTTYLSARAYSAQSAIYSEWYQNGIYDDNLGPIHDIGLDLNKQLGEHHFLKAGFDSQFEHPIHTFLRTTWAPEITFFNNNTEIFDFINPNGYCGANYYLGAGLMGMSTAQAVNYAATTNAGYCGYLYKYIKSNAPAIQAPADSALSDATRWTGGYYVTDRWTPSEKLTIDAGLRLDQANYHYPTPTLDPATCTSPYLPLTYVLPTDANGNPVPIVPGKVCPKETFADIGAADRPHITQPRIAALYKLTTQDVVRASYGRSFSWAPQSEVGTAYDLNKPGVFSNIPAYGNPAMYCYGYGDTSAAGPCDPNTLLPKNPAQSIGFYNVLWPYPCPLGMTLAQCKAWNPNFPNPPAGVPNPTGPTACGFAPYYVPCVNYQEQLNYETWNDLNYKAEPGGINPFAPATFSNYDISYEHEFANGFGPPVIRDFMQGVGVKVTAWARRGFNLQASTTMPGAPNVIAAYGAALYGGMLNPGVVGQEYANIFANGYSSQAFPNGSYGIGSEWDNGLELELTRERPYGLSLYYAATLNHTVSNLPSSYNSLAGSVPGASLFLHELYPEGFVPKFTATFVPSFKTHSGWRFAAQIFYNAGFPTGAGLYTPAYVGGCLNTVNGGFNPNTPCATQSALNQNVYLIPNTNLSTGLSPFSGLNPFGTNQATQYVDPLDPGSYLHPNIAATSGTAEGRYLNSKMTPPSSIINLQIEKELGQRLTVGFNLDNVWNQTYFGPQLNDRYQPVATGISGPLSGTTPGAYAAPGQAPSGYNYLSSAHGSSPYINFPLLEGRTYYIYFTVKNL